MKLYKYHGTISSMTGQNGKAQAIILHDTNDDDKAPTRLEVVGGIAKYIYDRDWTDTEERYIDSDYYFDCNLTLIHIEIPSTTPGIPAKVITQRTDRDMGVIIFGPNEYINDLKPERMDEENFSGWIKWERNQ